MSDIVERLREGPGDWQQEAADEIERLRGLLGQTFTMWMNDADPAELPELVQSIRQALGDEGAA